MTDMRKYINIVEASNVELRSKELESHVLEKLQAGEPLVKIILALSPKSLSTLHSALGTLVKVGAIKLNDSGNAEVLDGASNAVNSKRVKTAINWARTVRKRITNQGYAMAEYDILPIVQYVDDRFGGNISDPALKAALKTQFVDSGFIKFLISELAREAGARRSVHDFITMLGQRVDELEQNILS